MDCWFDRKVLKRNEIHGRVRKEGKERKDKTIEHGVTRKKAE
jgi:hypothetical protein